MTIEEAIKKLKEKYEYAESKQWIADPVIWALHMTLQEIYQEDE